LYSLFAEVSMRLGSILESFCKALAIVAACKALKSQLSFTEVLFLSNFIALLFPSIITWYLGLAESN